MIRRENVFLQFDLKGGFGYAKPCPTSAGLSRTRLSLGNAEVRTEPNASEAEVRAERSASEAEAQPKYTNFTTSNKAI